MQDTEFLVLPSKITTEMIEAGKNAINVSMGEDIVEEELLENIFNAMSKAAPKLFSIKCPEVREFISFKTEIG